MESSPSSSNVPRAPLYALSLIGPALVLVGNLTGGLWVMSGGVLVWVVLPLLEALERTGFGGFLEDKRGPLPRSIGLDLLLWAHVALQVAAMVTLVLLALEVGASWELWGAAFSTGTVTGSSGFIVAHELMHRPSPLQRAGSWLLLMFSLNTHFHVEHVHVHHRRVGTDEDPASARAADHPYLFVVTAAGGQLLHAWQVAWRKYPEQRGGQRTPYLTAMIRAALLNLLLVVVVAWISPVALLAFLAQAFLAVFLMNLVNYVEHWGLRRSSDEPVSAAHSWDTRSSVTRYTLFDLGMHADHHFRASKPYWSLEEHDEAPEMPVGLYAATMLALWPTGFRRLFAPALAAHQAEILTAPSS